MGGTNNGRGLNVGRTTGTLARQRQRREALLCAAATAAVALSLASPPRAEAAPMTDLVEMLDVVTPSVGQPVLNPDTGQDETVVEVISNGVVLTNDNNVIVLANADGDTIVFPDEPSVTYKVVKTYTDATTGDVYKVELSNQASTPVYHDVDLVKGGTPPTPVNGGGGSGSNPVGPPASAGTFRKVLQGATGSTGSPGGGISVCIPYIGCATIEYAPGAGGSGANGPDMSYVLSGDYNSKTAGAPAIQVISIGGNGGNGGFAIGVNIPGGEGGTAGAGGNVSVIASGAIASHYDNSAGIWAESRAGQGGQGGYGILFSSGGSGGNATHGGKVYVELTTSGTIQTYGNNSPGILAESLGGAGGNGGYSIGIVGQGGDANYGGDGGIVQVHQNGTIVTHGNFSYGVLAQSIGGSGGDAGTSYAVVTLGDSGSAGGNGSLAAIYAGSHSITITHGNYANALFAQSIGGGGGNGGSSGGLVTLGTTGAAGGNGGEALIKVYSGAYVETTGNASDGVVAQSIGGGGGSGGSSIGGVTLGSTGAGGGNASLAAIYDSGNVVTHGVDSIGVLAQSIGGGGGSSGAEGGIVTLGGTGSAGGYGGAVIVKINPGGSVITTGYGSDAVVAQSIGGGGGVGAGDGGLVALGSTGGSGGNGGTVKVYNYGLIETTSDQSRGILAESIGGGGGHGGDAGGLAAIGGNASNGGTGGNVYVTNTGEIFTQGNMSAGIEAQSIGGGGGDGGNAGGLLAIGGTAGAGGGGGSAYNGSSGKVVVNDSGFIQTKGNDSDGIFAQSVGGGGGNGGSATSVSAFVGVAIGGQGGYGGEGGDVTVNLTAGSVVIGNTTITGPVIITSGDRSAGIFEQSIGGGGGNGGSATQGTIGYIGSVSVAVGGKGGDGGNGGTVQLYGNATISTGGVGSGNNSDGIDIQSVGGGGGSGGFAVSVAVSGSAIAAGAISVGVGGAGGNGGYGGTVEVNAGGSIYTGGNFSTGLLAQSVGGGGGAGGFDVSVAAAGGGIASGSVSVGVGGTGGGGGHGGFVDVTFDGTIETKGNYAYGALIQSVGGGGGSGGFNVSAGMTESAGASGSVAVGIGGSGGVGGYGGEVIGRIENTVVTYGNHSDGIVIQSVGGGGGAGGFNISGAITGSLGVAGSVTVGLGGTGGGGGVGGNVYGYGAGITTHGNFSYGFLAQSVGGGGGAGGFDVSGGIDGGAGGAGDVSVGLGGNGGAAGNAGNVHGHVSGTVVTYGNFSDGVVVQSVGGGGGSGGFNVSGGITGSVADAGAVSVGLGGSGGAAGNAGNVYGYAQAIETHGDHSTGFLAQSVGGGGGAGGFNVSGTLSGAGGVSGDVSVGLGGSGGGGADAGNVTGKVYGVVVTYGNQSDGVVVQSIGGGGGSGGFNVSGALSFSGAASGAVSVGLGGSGGGAGNAGNVYGYATAITTHGNQSTGFIAQSVGGGGGAGGFDVSAGISGSAATAGQLAVGLGGNGGGGGTAGNVTGRVTGVVVTYGDQSGGVVVQSIGGGGGTGGFNVSGGIAGAGGGGVAVNVGLGGSGGGGSTAGNVYGYAEKAIETHGYQSTGFLAQSVGGGGGSGGFNVSGGIAGSGVGAAAVSVGLGGDGAGAGNAGNATGKVYGVVMTYGNQSDGVVVQSIGGGGGSGGFNVTGDLAGSGEGAGAVSVGLGGGGGGGGNAGNVTAYAVSIETHGNESTAFLAQSVGGGGGNGAFDVSGSLSGSGGVSGAVSVGIGGDGAGGGHAGNVYATVNGNVTTMGNQSDGIVAQSLGGGGGNGGFNVSGGITGSGAAGGSVSVGVGGSGGPGNYAGNVTLTVTGVTYTAGSQSDAILAQSVGGGGGNGAFNVTGDVAIAGTGAGTIGVGVGGSGGGGGAAGNVTLNVTGVVMYGETVAAITHGNYSSGVTAQSIGGGGGNGGFNVTGGISGAETLSGNIDVGVGGSGGTASSGGVVISYVTGDVFTEGKGSLGVLVQSAGGGGGSGGFNVSGGLTGAGTASGNIDVGVGGFGGGGGNGGNVYAGVTGNVQTLGADSSAITFQSMGGGGGEGGFDVSGGVAITVQSGGGSGNIDVGIGGFGGDGGHSGNVTGTVIGDIVTYGAGSHGLLVQSVGGGGGDGGFNVSGGIAGSSGAAGNIDVGLGGFGGGGGYSSNVTGNLTGNVLTEGNSSFGVTFQSLGGGGGDGGFNVTGDIAIGLSSSSGAGDIGVGIGGFGGSGGNSGNVTGIVTGNVTTLGYDSHGILMQSAAGGGGDGGFNVTGSLVASNGGAGSIGVGLGGFGGGAANAGNVYGTIIGNVGTEGNNSFGVTIQSMGGAGGDGGFNVTGGVALSLTDSVGAGTIGVGIGGFGGSGGNAGNVTGAMTGNIVTYGADSHGLLVQSAGGGGGDGGFNVSGGISGAANGAGNIDFGLGGFGGGGGNAGNVTGSITGNVVTRGYDSFGVSIQSLGGGGGDGAFNVTGSIAADVNSTSGSGDIGIGIGGFGGSGGNAYTVHGTVIGNVETVGDDSHGIMIQSAGGGGGSGGFNVTGALSFSTGSTGNIEFGLGGFGGSGGNAGAVYGNVTGNVLTEGNSSFGVTVQSMGGGGGNGGFNVTGGVQISSSGSGGAGSIGIGIGGFGGDGGHAGNVTSYMTGDITTYGSNSHGLLVQSAGGGGGDGGFDVTGGISLSTASAGNIDVGLGGFGGKGGYSGNVTGSLTGNVFTEGNNSFGVSIQSMGGGGGDGAFNVTGGMAFSESDSGVTGDIGVGIGGFGGNGGNSGNVTGIVTGNVTTLGYDSHGIMIQSAAGGGGDGGFNVSGGLAVSSSATGNFEFGLGGFGGSGGSAGNVYGTTVGNVFTEGNNSFGVSIQSVGGGGGNGGFDVTGGIAANFGSTGGAGDIGVGIGGFGGGGGDAGNVTGSVTGDIVTNGYDSHGVLIQSLGGGGGDGGFNVSGGISLAKGNSGNIDFGLGGFGGGAGSAGDVTGGVYGNVVVTHGDDSFGITIQSLGGGGGSGGFNVTGGLDASLAAGSNGSGVTGDIGIGIGGFGGGGGDGKNVYGTVVVGDVVTYGNNSHGILIQSAGGGGGDGGLNVTGDIGVTSGADGSIGIGVGGFGGSGGASGNVTGSVTGNVFTYGDKSFGVGIESVGGGGGTGGLDVTGSISVVTGDNTSVAIGIGLGGFGGSGGDAGNVDGYVSGTVVTRGDKSAGVIAASLGGGGAAGGINVTGDISLSVGNSGTVGIGMGGFGGDGGDAGNVYLRRVGVTETNGESSDGVTAESIGGGGGNGGLDVTGGLAVSTQNPNGGIAIGVGGFGGSGGNAGNVTLIVTGDVLALGSGASYTYTPTSGSKYTKTPDGSNGIVAQSIGGGGGNGGINISGQLDLTRNNPNSASNAATIGIGGFGGAGGNAGNVYLTVTGQSSTLATVVATGDDASAAIAQSIGGGGGNGGINISGGVSMDGQLTVGIGGFGANAGKGGNVYATVDANLYADGRFSRGLLVQSVGGGGGNGAIDISGGFELSSTGGEPSVVFGLGGFGGAGATSGNATATQYGQVEVSGFDAVGVLVQSVAGGGGSGGLNVAADVDLQKSTSKTTGIGVAVGIGGSGGNGANAGNATLYSVGLVFADDTQDNSQTGSGIPTGTAPASRFNAGAGVMVESIGGGGGVGGIDATGVIAPFGSPMVLGVGGSGGDGGNAGNVLVVRGYTGSIGSLTASPTEIVTEGDSTDGLVAQSIGGGGGDAGMNFTLGLSIKGTTQSTEAVLINVGGGGGDAGMAGNVVVHDDEAIFTYGVAATGLLAQSIGGGGGNANLNIGGGLTSVQEAVTLTIGGGTGDGGDGGNVSVYHVGDIVTHGADAFGIEAESVGGGGGNNVFDIGIAATAKDQLNITIGRDGGTGGTGGDVYVNSNGIIETSGQDAVGILAQSVGGGGGTSSASSIGAQVTNPSNADDQGQASMAMGLMGGYGSTGGSVKVKAEDEIVTYGSGADGILAQSIGGGGGKGGSATSVDVLVPTSVTMGMGGTGGTGAAGGYVYVDSSAIIVTTGNSSDGIMAQSVGGGGGLGGMARQIQLNATFGKAPGKQENNSVGISMGGDGGTGADGGNVTVINSGTIVTNGEASYGVGAQSIGGGGGIGGAVVDLSAVVQQTTTSVDVNIGGSGGKGGDGGVVKVTNTGLIETYGADAVGIEAESVGGGGGNAGLIMVATLGGGVGNVSNNRFTFNIGGEGGDGATGGNVFVYNTPVAGHQFSGDIITHGQTAYGILAQSIGGGGGNGSDVINGLLTATSSGNSVGFSLNVGGIGGTGGDAGNVTVVNAGMIETYGAGAHGIVAQSIGGGGGNSGMSISGTLQIGTLAQTQKSPMISIGGLGGDGGNGGTVTVTNTGTIVTNGADADGIFAESIGGGGGNAEMGLSVGPDPVSLLLSNSISALIGAVGGGAGGKGGDVIVNQYGSIVVLGQGSQAIDAESINGGGGTLSESFQGIASLPGVTAIGSNSPPNPKDPLDSASAGASYATGSSGGNVQINMTGAAEAAGADSVAMFEQSIGGGGGTIRFDIVMGNATNYTNYGALSGVGFAASLGGTDGSHNNGGDIVSNQSGMIVTSGSNSPGALIQSIGGGGGRAVFDIYAPAGSTVDPITFNLGGTNGSYESGGNITFTHDGMILTGGVLSTGEIIQSVGGGGGEASLYLHGANAGHTAVYVTLGSDGGSNLNGGNIDATFSGGVITEGDHANGLFIQSVGGGGGVAQIQGASSLDVTIGGGAGNGGNVYLTNTGGVYTFGDGSNGVFLQSIGGGGGAVMVGVDPPDVTLSGGGIGNGGNIVFTQTGDIEVMGADSIGIIAQSIGGGGGYVEGSFHGTAGGVGQGGSIDLTIDGKILALEANSTGVFAESTGSLGGGDIDITAEDMIRGGSGTGVGISIDGGADNVINIENSLSAVSGVAIVATSGNDTVNNTGLVIGDVNLGGGVNVFNNEFGATFIAFHSIILQDASAGSSGVFINSGEFQMGLSAPLVPIDLLNGATFANDDGNGDPRYNLLYGARVIETVNLEGSFVQTSTGHLDFDVAFGPYPSDLVNVSGNTTVAGTGNIILTWLQDDTPVTLFATKGVATNDGLKIAPTLAVDFGIIADTAGIQLTIQTNFGQPFLTPNEQRLGHMMDSAVEVGNSAGIGRLLAYLGNMTSSQQALYASVFDQLNPEPLVAALRAQMDEANTFGNDLFGCLSTTTTTVDKDCVWTKGGEFSDRNKAEGGYWGSDDIGNDARGGWQRPIDGVWSMTAAAGYQSITDMSVNNGRARASGQGGDLGVGFQRRTPDGLALSFGVTGGWTALDMARQVDVFQPGVGHSDIQTGYAQVQVDASKLYTSGRWFVRPEVNFTSTMLRTNGFAETGLAGIGVTSAGNTHISEAAQPDLAFGRVLYDGDQQRAELTFKIGGRFSTDNDLFLPITFVGAGQGTHPADIQTPYNAAAGVASVDLDVFGNGPLSLSVDFTTEWGRESSNQRGTVDLKYKF